MKTKLIDFLKQLPPMFSDADYEAQANEILALLDVVGQSEHLPCKHPENRIWYNDENQMRCNECGEEF